MFTDVIAVQCESHINTGHTEKNGAVSIVFTIETAPFFCVYPVHRIYTLFGQNTKFLTDQAGDA